MTDGSTRAGAFTAGSLPADYERLIAPYLFEPWAEVLLDAVALAPGAAVLDVASGTGVVARAAARRTGAEGRVVATDISPAMIEFCASHPAEPAAAPIETAVASATELGRADGEFDVVLCQQGMPFFPDRPGAAREMRRVLRPGGVAGIAVWTPDREVQPFAQWNETLRDLGVAEPFPGAWDISTFVMGVDELADLLRAAGFTDVESREVELVTRWPSVDHLVDAVMGTPFGALLAGMDADRLEEARHRMAQKSTKFVSNGAVVVPTYAAIGRGSG
ncbi:MAG TPA: methyltransferase domain-containing protein [Jatrophihabitantaceae bacterium]